MLTYAYDIKFYEVLDEGFKILYMNNYIWYMPHFLV